MVRGAAGRKLAAAQAVLFGIRLQRATRLQAWVRMQTARRRARDEEKEALAEALVEPPMPFCLAPEELAFVRAFEHDSLQRHVLAGTVLLRAWGTGVGRGAVRVSLRNCTAQPLKVRLARGTFFLCASAGAQPLALHSEHWVTLGPRRTDSSMASEV